MALRFRATSLRCVLARERLIAEYLYLCRRAARRFVRRGLDRADLEQVGAIGLIKAADRYDPSQRAPFEAYAWLLIVGELMHYVRDCERFVRAPRAVRDLDRRWKVAERELWGMLGREPTDNDIAQFVGASPAQACEIRAYRATSRVVSFEVLGNGDQGVPACAVDDILDQLTVERMLERLSPLERQIVRSIHIDGVTVVDLAARLGYSRRHVTRLHRAAIDRLKVGAQRNAEDTG
ncbi:MAG: sigma-70 family RNA polymerase sigma factor [Candidatus Eremiobacteraeota bacterium]|nr:sigma-70 family RNA polymerase sigma factor [Candidatus Eremiobacteraeota bacterium]